MVISEGEYNGMKLILIDDFPHLTFRQQTEPPKKPKRQQPYISPNKCYRCTEIMPNRRRNICNKCLIELSTDITWTKKTYGI